MHFRIGMVASRFRGEFMVEFSPQKNLNRTSVQAVWTFKIHTCQKKQDVNDRSEVVSGSPRGTVRIAKEGTLTNLADLFTKPLVQAARERLLDRFTY